MVQHVLRTIRSLMILWRVITSETIAQQTNHQTTHQTTAAPTTVVAVVMVVAAKAVAVLVNKEGMPTGEPIPRDTAHPNWKISAPVAQRDVRVRLPLDRLLEINC